MGQTKKNPVAGFKHSRFRLHLSQYPEKIFPIFKDIFHINFGF